MNLKPLTKSESFLLKITEGIKHNRICRLTFVMYQHNYNVNGIEQYQPVCTKPCSKEWSPV